ncbi:MAG: 2-C-methyl-D-erythritol 2,4-cyclodiphosphate synthase [Parachlamydiales bacterium]|nr:2-C-methyl-D-erythritol 2,4-cyclodiphosphate synthase [Parachlamydiales bacterium]
MKQDFPIYKTGLGQDSHRFLDSGATKPCIISGVIFEDMPGLAADSDGDVVFHAICNAITSITGIPILADVAVDLCFKDGITDSKVYLEKAVLTLKSFTVTHLAISIEGKRPRFQKKINEMRKNIADILKLDISQVGMTATSGDGLTDFGCGDGIQVFCIITAFQNY